MYACKKDAVEKPLDMKYSYFPMDTGRWVEYTVDSIVWNDFYPESDSRHVDTFNFKIRESLDSYFIDIQGKQALKIVRYKKVNDTSAWFIKDVWFANLTNTTAEKVEENQRYIKLVFPLKDGSSWNGNEYNTMDAWAYECKSVDAPLVINGLSFDSAAVILQYDQTTLINRIYGKEVYAKNVGLVFKEYINVETNPSDMSVKNGMKYKMQVTAWGKK